MTQARSDRSRWFFAVFAGLLLAIVLVGFSPTFYLRPFFRTRPLPAYLYLHGALLTAWFGLLFLQSCLVATRNMPMHRRIGVAGALVAAALVPVSAMVAVRSIERFSANNFAPRRIQEIVIGDLLALVLFSVLVALAVHWRHRPDWHKRLMTVACITIIGPAVSRVVSLLSVPPPVLLLLLLLPLPVHDLVTRRRVHRATAIGLLALVGALFLTQTVAGTPTGQSVLDALPGR